MIIETNVYKLKIKAFEKKIEKEGRIKMKITNVEIKKVEKEGSRLRGVANITLNNCLAIHNIRIIEGSKGLFVAMPSRKTEEGKYVDLVHPINSETRKMFEEEIMAKYNEI